LASPRKQPRVRRDPHRRQAAAMAGRVPWLHSTDRGRPGGRSLRSRSRSRAGLCLGDIPRPRQGRSRRRRGARFRGGLPAAAEVADAAPATALRPEGPCCPWVRRCRDCPGSRSLADAGKSLADDSCFVRVAALVFCGAVLLWVVARTLHLRRLIWANPIVRSAYFGAIA
jgi:hypothetical protein